MRSPIQVAPGATSWSCRENLTNLTPSSAARRTHGFNAQAEDDIGHAMLTNFPFSFWIRAVSSIRSARFSVTFASSVLGPARAREGAPDAAEEGAEGGSPCAQSTPTPSSVSKPVQRDVDAGARATAAHEDVAVATTALPKGAR